MEILQSCTKPWISFHVRHNIKPINDDKKTIFTVHTSTLYWSVSESVCVCVGGGWGVGGGGGGVGGGGG